MLLFLELLTVVVIKNVTFKSSNIPFLPHVLTHLDFIVQLYVCYSVFNQGMCWACLQRTVRVCYFYFVLPTGKAFC